MAEILLHPIGKIPEEVLRDIKEGLKEILGFEAEIGKELSLPPSAFNPKRNQYLAEEILGTLKAKKELVLGIADIDLYTPGLNFVFGLARPHAKTALISLTRLRQEFYDLPQNEALFLERAIKEAVHEIGHLLGLGHCSNKKCVMAFSNSLADTDRKGKQFCPQCSMRVKK